MAKSLIKSVAFFALVWLLGAMAAEADITCSQATSDLSPCVPYLTGQSTTYASNCCAGVRNIADSVSTSDERRRLCVCLKNAAIAMNNINIDRTAALPGQCGVNLPFPISRDIDCNSVNVV